MATFAGRAYPLPMCDAPRCTGHLGKFDSCRDEALYSLTLDGMTGESTGDTDWHHHVTLIDTSDWSEADRTVAECGGVVIPRGVYLVWVLPTGNVTVTVYGTYREAERTFADVQHEYEAWSAGEDVPDDDFH